MKSEIVKLGVVGVDSGQLVICDPAYLVGQFQTPYSKGKDDHAHTVYKHKDGKLWQFCYDGKSPVKNANPFPGTYENIIPEYGLTPNELITQGLFKETDIDPTPHIPKAEFSYRGICKTTDSENQGGQLNYLLGNEGVAVAVRTGLGDGTYDVFAEIADTESLGKRIKKVWVEFITDNQLKVTKTRLIKIDTNGDNAGKYTQNVELFDLITPNILMLINEDGDVYMGTEIDWIKTREQFDPGENGHCICLKKLGYVAAYEFVSLIVEVDNGSIANTLSELCDELAELHKIESWTVR